VTFHGYVDEAVIPGVYERFDVLAVPSVPTPGWIEQFGQGGGRGQASGVPVVASASGALPDVVGEDGLLVSPGQPGGAAASLSRFLDEPGLWDRLRAAGIAAATKYSWDSVADAQMDLYRLVSGEEGRDSDDASRLPVTAPTLPASLTWRYRARGGRRARASEKSAVGARAGGPRPGPARGRSSLSVTNASAAASAWSGGNRIPSLPTVSRWAPPPRRHHRYPCAIASTTEQPEGLGPGAGASSTDAPASNRSVSATLRGTRRCRRPPRAWAVLASEAAGHHHRRSSAANPDRQGRSSTRRGCRPPGPFRTRTLQHQHGGRFQFGLGPIGDPVGDEHGGTVDCSRPRTGLMAMSRAMARLVIRASIRAVGLEPRSLAKWRVATRGAPLHRSGEPRRAFGPGHVEMDDVAPRWRARARAAWMSVLAGRLRAVSSQLGPHSFRVPTDGGDPVAAGAPGGWATGTT